MVTVDEVTVTAAAETASATAAGLAVFVTVVGVDVAVRVGLTEGADVAVGVGLGARNEGQVTLVETGVALKFLYHSSAFEGVVVVPGCLTLGV